MLEEVFGSKLGALAREILPMADESSLESYDSDDDEADVMLGAPAVPEYSVQSKLQWEGKIAELQREGDAPGVAAYRSALAWLRHDEAPWQMAEAWRDVAREAMCMLDSEVHRPQALLAAQMAGEADPEFAVEERRESLRLEARTWELVRRLHFDLEASSSGSVSDVPKTPAEAVARCREQTDMRFLLSILQWLQENEGDDLAPVHARTAFLRAKRHFVSPPSSSRKTESANVFERSWMFVRHGRLDEAERLLLRSGQPLASAVLAGRTWSDGVDDGTPHRRLWREQTAGLAQTSALKHEAALYGAVALEEASVLAVAETWEDEVWARLWVQARRLEEFAVEDCQPAADYALDLEVGAKIAFPPAEPAAAGVRRALQQLPHSPREWVRVENQHPFRMVQAYLMTDDLKGLLMCLASWAAQEEGEAEEATLSSSCSEAILRFAAHFVVLFRTAFGGRRELQQTPELVDACDRVVRAYGLRLARSDRAELLAQYLTLLPVRTQTEEYAKLLRGLERVEDWRTYYTLGFEAHLPMPAITQQVVRMALAWVPSTPAPMAALSMMLDADGTQTASALLTSTLHGSAAPQERHSDMIRAVQWLSFDPAQREDYLAQVNSLARYFLLQNAREDAKRLLNEAAQELQSLPEMGLGSDGGLAEEDEEEAELNLMPQPRNHREFFHLRLYLRFYQNFTTYKLKRRERPTATENADHDLALLAWQQDVHALAKVCVDNIRQILYGPLGGWLFEPSAPASDDPARATELHRLRKTILPRLVLLLHDLLFDLKDYLACQNLALEVVEHDLLMEFDSSQASKFLDSLRKSSLALLESDPSLYILSSQNTNPT